jgi:hypothetical protein
VSGIETGDYTSLSDRDLAVALHRADVSGDTDTVLYAENEIAVRLNLDPNETEQGLTQYAADRVNDFLREHGDDAVKADLR